MNLVLLLPAALAALLSLAIPLLIHLARRQQQRVTPFAALRWLQAHARPRRRVRFDEWLLLLLRLVLLAALVVWLARPVLLSAPDNTAWTVVVPGVAESEVRAAAARAGDGHVVRWLAPDYPPLDGTTPAPAGTRHVASLLRQLDAQLPATAPLEIWVPERLDGLDGGELRLSRDVVWRVVDGAPASRTDALDRLVPLHVRHDADSADAVRYLRAATLATWPDAAPADVFDAAASGEPWPDDARRIAWLASGPLPADLLRWIEAGGDALVSSTVVLPTPPGETFVAWRDGDGRPLLEVAALGRGRVSRLLRPLRPADMPELASPDFPRRLQAVFDDAPAPGMAWAQSQAPLAGAEASPPEPRELRAWLALLVALLALAERWLATSPRREARA